MLITAASVLMLFAFLFRSLRQAFYGLHLAAVLASLFFIGGGWQAGAPFSAESLWRFLTVHLVWINIAVFLAYAYDKRAARQGNWRVKEKSLHTMAFLGGTPGAFLASRIFRHKTKKVPFRIMFWLVTGLQIALATVLYTIATS
jgi:uncharacterized membrane protein YsdA (DUF1294 family)